MTQCFCLVRNHRMNDALKNPSQFGAKHVRVLLTDIDGTLTEHGRLRAETYRALERLDEAGIAVVPVTGRPAGWCEMIARLWPVHGVIGENGAFYFRRDQGRMRRWFARAPDLRRQDRRALRQIRREVLATVPGCAVASDQFCRQFDLAIDFAEDVGPLNKIDIQKIVATFGRHGATAKVSDIHVNGWFGDHDKVSTAKVYLNAEFAMKSEAEMRARCAFAGDSPNDEPMFAYFEHAFAVANIAKFLPELRHKPAYVTEAAEGRGFLEIAECLLAVLDI